MSVNSSANSGLDRDQVTPLAILGGMLAVLVFGAYWNSLAAVAERWQGDQYSHGYLIPVFTLALLYLRYQPIRLSEVTPAARWTGVGLMVAGLCGLMGFTYVYFTVLQNWSFIPCVAGLFLAVGGWRTARWSWPATLFLIFMYPLPHQLDSGLLAPLQNFATKVSTYCLQTMGIAAVREGNKILIAQLDQPLGVEEACSGLRMLTIFMALAVALILITDRPIWQRIVIVISAVPIALAVNITRIILTACLYLFVANGTLSIDKETVDKLFHDMAGWLMMPMALGLLYLVFQVLDHLFIEEESGPLPIGMQMRPPGAPV